AEATADVRGDDANLALLHAETIGKAVARDVRHLRTRIERELIEAVIEGRNDAAAFERRHALPRGRYLTRYLDRRIEGRRDIDLEIGLEEDVVAPIFMNQSRTRLARLEHVINSWNILPVERPPSHTLIP